MQIIFYNDNHTTDIPLRIVFVFRSVFAMF